MSENADSRPMAKRNVTTLSLTDAEERNFNKACDFYSMSKRADFFRNCVAALTYHAQRGDRLLQPLRFEAQEKNDDNRAI
jgi:hypothetical protein